MSKTIKEHLIKSILLYCEASCSHLRDNFYLILSSRTSKARSITRGRLIANLGEVAWFRSKVSIIYSNKVKLHRLSLVRLRKHDFNASLIIIETFLWEACNPYVQSSRKTNWMIKFRMILFINRVCKN